MVLETWLFFFHTIPWTKESLCSLCVYVSRGIRSMKTGSSPWLGMGVLASAPALWVFLVVLFVLVVGFFCVVVFGFFFLFFPWVTLVKLFHYSIPFFFFAYRPSPPPFYCLRWRQWQPVLELLDITDKISLDLFMSVWVLLFLISWLSDLNSTWPCFSCLSGL